MTKTTTRIKNPLVISYIRFSSERQGQGDSFRRQAAMADEYCKQHGLTLTDSFQDLGISSYRGKNIEKGALNELLQLVEEGKIPVGSMLLIEELDRLSRAKPHKSLTLLFNIIEAGVTVVTLKDGEQYTAENLDMNRLMMSVLRLSLAHAESEKKSVRLAQMWGEKKRKAAAEGKPMTKVCPAWLTKKGDKFEVVEEKAALVREIYSMALQGIGARTIAKTLNEQGRSITKSGHFTRSYVVKILSTPTVIGLFQPRKVQYSGSQAGFVPDGDTLTNYYPAILDEKTFYAVQSILNTRKGSIYTPKGNVYVNILQKVLQTPAGDAIHIMRAALDKSKTAYDKYYYAATSTLHGLDKNPYYPGQTLDLAIIFKVAEVGAALVDKEQAQGLDADAIRGKILTIEGKLDALADALDDVGMVQTVVKKIKELEEQKAALVATLNELKAQPAPKADDLTFFKWLRGNEFREILPKLEETETRLRIRQVIKKFVSKIVVKFDRKDVYNVATCEMFLNNGTCKKFTVSAHVRAKEIVCVKEGKQQDFLIPVQDWRGCNIYTIWLAKQMIQKGIKTVTIAEKTGMGKEKIWSLAKELKANKD